MKKIRRINILGGPGTGKSTIASWIFQNLKENHQPVELITEYIKSWAWRKLPPASWDQLYIFAKQLNREDVILRAGYTFLVTDAALLQMMMYIKLYKCPFWQQAAELEKLYDTEFPSINILLRRTVSYQQEGRYQNEEEAKDVDKLLLDVMYTRGILSAPTTMCFDPVNDNKYNLMNFIYENINAEEVKV